MEKLYLAKYLIIPKRKIYIDNNELDFISSEIFKTLEINVNSNPTFYNYIIDNRHILKSLIGIYIQNELRRRKYNTIIKNCIVINKKSLYNKDEELKEYLRIKLMYNKNIDIIYKSDTLSDMIIKMIYKLFKDNNEIYKDYKLEEFKKVLHNHVWTYIYYTTLYEIRKVYNSKLGKNNILYFLNPDVVNFDMIMEINRNYNINFNLYEYSPKRKIYYILGFLFEVLDNNTLFNFHSINLEILLDLYITFNVKMIIDIENIIFEEIENNRMIIRRKYFITQKKKDYLNYLLYGKEPIFQFKFNSIL